MDGVSLGLNKLFGKVGERKRRISPHKTLYQQKKQNLHFNIGAKIQYLFEVSVVNLSTATNDLVRMVMAMKPSKIE